MKDEEIRAEAERQDKFFDETCVLQYDEFCFGFREGAKWHREHSDAKSTLCQCVNEDMTGCIELKCCNICGKPIKEHGIEGFIGCPQIEKLNELRDEYVAKERAIRLMLSNETDTMSEEDLITLIERRRRYNEFEFKLNAIIEKP